MFPEGLKAREAYILERVTAGDYEHDWVEISPGCSASADALRVHGVRVNVSHRLQLEIARLLGAQLPTQIVCDVRHTLAQVIVPPVVLPISSSVEAMVEHSRRIDQAIQERYPDTDTSGLIVSSVGKTWIWGEQTRNYGMHTDQKVYKGIKCEASTVPGLYVIQGPWAKHGPDHSDYSQTCQLVRMG